MRVAVYGLGNVGSALVAALLNAGFEVIGVDIKEKLVKDLNAGRIKSKEPGVKEAIRKGLKKGLFRATLDGVEASKQSKVKIIIVPVVLDKRNKADLKPLINATKVIAKGLKKGDLVITETTLPIGTTANVVTPLLEKGSKLKAGKDFFVAHAPERVYVGRILEDYKKYKKVVGGINRASGLKAKKFYEKLFPKGVILMENSDAAEAAKIFGILYRNTNIALANELYRICERFGINFWKVREAVNSIGFFHIHKPGIPGGYCVPVYPHFVSHLPEAELIRKVLEINEKKMVGYHVKKLEKELRKIGKKLKNSKVLILGRSFRAGVKEDAYSASLKFVKALKNKVKALIMYDPLYKKEEMEALGVKGVDSLKDVIRKVDAVIIANDNRKFRIVKKIFKGPIIDVFGVLED